MDLEILWMSQWSCEISKDYLKAQKAQKFKFKAARPIHCVVLKQLAIKLNILDIKINFIVF